MATLAEERRHKGPRQRPQLVFFHSKTDGPSRRVEGYLAHLLQRRHNHATFVLHFVDVDERSDLAERFCIEKVPTLLVVADQKVEGRLTCPKGCRDIETLLRPWLASGEGVRRGAAGHPL